MNEFETKLRAILDSSVSVEQLQLPGYKSMKEFIPSCYTKSSQVPLIYLSRPIYERLISEDIMYYEPEAEVIVEDHDNYLWVKIHYFSLLDYVYIIKREKDNSYSIRGFIGYDKFSFAPKDIDTEKFKNFIADTCVPFYYQNISFDYSIHIEQLVQ